MNEEQNERSFGDKLSDFLDRNQVKIQLLTIYAGLIGIILEGNYSDNSIFLHMADEHGDWLILKLNVLENRLLAQEPIWEHQVRINIV